MSNAQPSNFSLVPAARADLDGIWEYTVQQWGLDQAEFYVGKIRAAVELLAHNPRRGRTCSEIRVGYFKYVVGSHVIFYRPLDRGIVVMRILHGRMDFDSNL